MFILKNVSDTFLPITILKWTLGIGVIEFPFGRPRVSLSLLYATFLFIVAAISSIIFKQRFGDNDGTKVNPNAAIFDYIFIYGNLLFYLIAIIIERTHGEELKQCFQEINIVKEQFESIGIREKLNRLLVKHLCLITILITLTVFTEVAELVTDGSKINLHTKILRALSILFLIIVPLIMELQFLCIISYLKGTFIQLNNLLQKLTGCDSVHTQYAKVFCYKIGLGQATNFKLGQRTTDDLAMIRTSKTIHLDLVKICKTVNHVFGLQILISLGISITVLTVASFDVFSAAFIPPEKDKEEENDIFIVIYLFCYYVIKVLAVNHLCHMASEEALCTRSIICELHEPTTNTEFRAELDEFILQLKQNPVVFTAHGCFNLNHNFIQSVVGMVTTYLVILVQMKMESQKSAN